jgi:hypothetical protein
VFSAKYAELGEEDAVVGYGKKVAVIEGPPVTRKVQVDELPANEQSPPHPINS